MLWLLSLRLMANCQGTEQELGRMRAVNKLEHNRMSAMLLCLHTRTRIYRIKQLNAQTIYNYFFLPWYLSSNRLMLIHRIHMFSLCFSLFFAFVFIWKIIFTALRLTFIVELEVISPPSINAHNALLWKCVCFFFLFVCFSFDVLFLHAVFFYFAFVHASIWFWPLRWMTFASSTKTPVPSSNVAIQIQ